MLIHLTRNLYILLSLEKHFILRLTSFSTGETLGMGNKSIPPVRFSCPTTLSSSPQQGRSHLPPPRTREGVPHLRVSRGKLEDNLSHPQRWVRIFITLVKLDCTFQVPCYTGFLMSEMESFSRH